MELEAEARESVRPVPDEETNCFISSNDSGISGYRNPVVREPRMKSRARCFVLGDSLLYTVMPAVSIATMRPPITAQRMCSSVFISEQSRQKKSA